MLSLGRGRSVSILQLLKNAAKYALGCKNRLRGRRERNRPKLGQPSNPRKPAPRRGGYSGRCEPHFCSLKVCPVICERFENYLILSYEFSCAPPETPRDASRLRICVVLLWGRVAQRAIACRRLGRRAGRSRPTPRRARRNMHRRTCRPPPHYPLYRLCARSRSRRQRHVGLNDR